MARGEALSCLRQASAARASTSVRVARRSVSCAARARSAGLRSSSGTGMPYCWASSCTVSTKPAPVWSIRKPMALPFLPQPKQW